MDERIPRRPVIRPWRRVLKLYINATLRDGVVTRRKFVAIPTFVLQIVVPCVRVKRYGVLDMPITYARIRVHVDGLRRVRCVVILRQTIECDKIVQRSTRDDLARRILDRRSRIVLLRQWVHRDVHIAL